MEDLVGKNQQIYLSIVYSIWSFEYISLVSLRIKHEMPLDLFVIPCAMDVL